MSHTMKLWEKMIEHKLRLRIGIFENQISFMSGRATIEAIYLLRGLMKKYQCKDKDLHMVFIALQKGMIMYREKYFRRH